MYTKTGKLALEVLHSSEAIPKLGRITFHGLCLKVGETSHSSSKSVKYGHSEPVPTRYFRLLSRSQLRAVSRATGAVKRKVRILGIV